MNYCNLRRHTGRRIIIPSCVIVVVNALYNDIFKSNKHGDINVCNLEHGDPGS